MRYLHSYTYIVFCFILLLLPQRIMGTGATNPYIPKIENYSVSDYRAGNQNWSVVQGEDGSIYFGNNRGLLIFDGVRWRLYPFPGHTPVRSVHVGTDRRIYVGGFEEFGYYQPDEKGDFIYHSLKSLVNDYRFFNDEIWTINEYRGNIYFQSFSSYFVYDGNGVKKGEPGSHPLYFFALYNHLYAQFIGRDLCRMEAGRFVTVLSREKLNHDNVVSMLPYDDKILLVTAKNGLYLYSGDEVVPWPTASDQILKTGVVNRAICLPDSTYVIGTLADGLVAIDKQGALRWHLNREKGLINNSVLGLNSDRSGNVWVAMDNGISYIQVNSPLYFYERADAQIGMVHDIVIKNGQVYLASNQGVYSFSEDDAVPRLIPGTEEQTWYITDVGSQLIAGHNRGTLFIKDTKARLIDGPSGGGTALRKSVVHGKEVLVQASYTNLSIFTQTTAGNWDFSHNIEGFSNLIKSLEIDPAGTIWASHMFKGLYRITLDETLRTVKQMEYIGKLQKGREEGRINVMKLRGRIVLTDGEQFYTYEDLSDSIVPYDVLNNDFPDLGDTYRIVPLNNDLFWFIRNTEYVLLSYEGGRYVLRKRIPYTMFKHPTIEDRGNIFINDDGLSYFCLNGGMALYDPFREKADTLHIPLTLSSVSARNRYNSNSYLLPNRLPADISLPYAYNNITFEFAYPDYGKRYDHIRYKLDGFDQEWSEESSDFMKSYSNLPYGKYTLLAFVENSAGDTSASISYPFQIKRPFYRSMGAVTIYILIGMLFFVWLIRLYIQWTISRENRSMEACRQKQKEELERQEQLIVQLKNEQLEKELTYKSKELASITLARISQADFLEDLKKEIKHQQLSGTNPKHFYEKVTRLIDENLDQKDEWALYQANFDRIHENFFFKLKERYPDLTPGDLRMCALLRLNMPSKDMAKMLNLSVRGIEAARYRLRKKLELAEGENLVDFMIRI